MEAFLHSFSGMSGWGRVCVVASTICLLTGSYGVLWGLRARQKHRRLLGRVRFRGCCRFTRLAGLLAPRIRAMAFGKWLCFLVGGYLIFGQWPQVHSPLTLLIGALLTMIGLLQYARQAQPGTILVLGSGKQTIDLHEILTGTGGAFPLRTISLLETGDILFDTKIAGDCFRIDKAHDWRHVAFGFADHAAAVVMDCRRPTRLVKEECEHILEKHPHKAVFVVPSLEEEAGHQGCWPILSQKRASTLILDEVDACPRFLGFLLKYLEVCPSPEHPIADYYAPFREHEQKDRDKRNRDRISLRPQMPFGWGLVTMPPPRNPDAIEAYHKASSAEVGARRWLLLGLIGMFETAQRRYRDQQKIALALHRRATQLEPECAKLFTAFGITLARNDYLEEALEVFKRAEALSPANAWVEINMGNCYAGMGMREQAESYWSMADSRRRHAG